MRELPSGTVTLLFTDIEGSTRLTQELGSRYPEVLAAHRDLLRAAFSAHEGQEVDTQGDSFFVVFPRATQAVLAAVEAQQALAVHRWPEDGVVRVRMGLYTGEPLRTSEGYAGLDVVRAARIAAAGHGGQVLLSRVAVELVQQQLPDGVALRDLGEHRLKDLPQPEHLAQLVIPGVPDAFAPLRSLNNRPNNLPVQFTPLIGREREVVEVCELLRHDGVRLVTLTGPGGTGKTRLALQAAAELVENFPDGVWFVALAPIAEPHLVVSALAQTLGVRESSNVPLLETLQSVLRSKELLLVLDNFEQVAAAAPLVSALLIACPRLRVLATSRVVLHLSGEHDLAVPPLALPDRASASELSAEKLSHYEAVQLFIERAQAARSDFAVTNANAPAVAEICLRLDGLPLALELAAARVRLLPPQALLARLDQRLRLLTGGARNLPERQQTLRGAITWSHHLLDEAEQRLFRRLAVFAGGWSLEAAEAVTDVDGDLDVLEGLSSLADNSLVRQEATAGGETRFGMLETIREYGLEQLAASGEIERLRRQHARYFLALAEAAQTKLRRREQAAWAERLEHERDNLRAAMAWCQAAGSADPEAVEWGLRLPGVLCWYTWFLTGQHLEGRRWLEDGLAAAVSTGAEQNAAWALALAGAGYLAWAQGDAAVGRMRLSESVARLRELGSDRDLAWALLGAGPVLMSEDDPAHGRELVEEGLAIYRAEGDAWGTALALLLLGVLAQWQQDNGRAVALLEESAALWRGLGDEVSLVIPLQNLGTVALRQGDVGRAAAHLAEGLALARKQDSRWMIGYCLIGIGGVAALRGQAETAAQIFGAAEVLFERIGTALQPVDRIDLERLVAVARAMLDEAAFRQAWAAGRALPLEAAASVALETTSAALAEDPPPMHRVMA